MDLINKLKHEIKFWYRSFVLGELCSWCGWPTEIVGWNDRSECTNPKCTRDDIEIPKT